MKINQQTKSEKALQAFQGDLPHLLIERPGEWVAYEGGQQIAFSSHKHELYQECFRRGIARDDLVVFCIEPQETEISLGPIVVD
jgi:hypothetical protein